MKWSVIAFELVGFVSVGFLIGSALEQVWEMQGVFQAGGIILAFLLWVVFIWKKLQF